MEPENTVSGNQHIDIWSGAIEHMITTCDEELRYDTKRHTSAHQLRAFIEIVTVVLSMHAWGSFPQSTH